MLNEEFSDITYQGYLVTTRKQPDGSYETTFYIEGKCAAVHITSNPCPMRPADVIKEDAAKNHEYFARRIRSLSLYRSDDTDQQVRLIREASDITYGVMRPERAA